MPGLKLSTSLSRKLGGVRLTSARTATAEVRKLKLRRADLAPSIAHMASASRTKGIRFTQGIIANWKNDQTAAADAEVMIGWARRAGQQQRRMMVRAFRLSGQGARVVHNIGGMNRKDARNFMKDFFTEGGREEDVAEWLAKAGQVIRSEKPANENTDGFWGKVGSWFKGAIKTVGDALKAAGKSLSKAMNKVLKWSASKIADFVEGLIRMGKSVATILAEAVRKGTAALKKFVRAVLDAGRRVAEILAWAVRQALSTLKSVVSELLRLGRGVAHILAEAATRGLTILKKTVEALIRLGRRVRDVLAWAAVKSFTTLKSVVQELIRLGKSVAHILAEAAARSLSIVRNTVRALIGVGRRMAEVLAWAANKVANVLRTVVQELLRLGSRVAQILGEAARRGATAILRVTSALAKLGRKVGEILREAAKLAASAVVSVVKGLITAGRKLGEVLREVVRYTGSALKKLVAATYKGFRKAGAILAAFAKDQFNTIRMVLDGLLGAGLQLGKAIVAIVKNVGSEFRKGFFQGLVALGKSPLLIMKEALKAAGGIAALAFAALLDVLGGHRGLNKEEIRQARRLYGYSIDLGRVKVAVASIPSDLIHLINGGRPFTTMYVINFASWQKVNIKTLMHELAHVWQGVVAGPVYMVEALHAQAKYGRNAYRVTNQMLRDNKNELAKFNREQQAVIAEEFWYEQWGKTDYPRLTGRGLDVNLLRPYARRMYKAATRRTIRFNPIVPTVVANIRPLRLAVN